MTLEAVRNADHIVRRFCRRFGLVIVAFCWRWFGTRRRIPVICSWCGTTLKYFDYPKKDVTHLYSYFSHTGCTYPYYAQPSTRKRHDD